MITSTCLNYYAFPMQTHTQREIKIISEQSTIQNNNNNNAKYEEKRNESKRNQNRNNFQAGIHFHAIEMIKYSLYRYYNAINLMLCLFVCTIKFYTMCIGYAVW